MPGVKAHELRSKEEDALVADLMAHRKELASLRVSKISSQPQVKLSKIRVSNNLCGSWCFCSPSVKLSPASWPSCPRSASPPPAKNTKARSTLPVTFAKRRPAPSAASSPPTKPRRWPNVPKRSTTTSSSASSPSLPELHPFDGATHPWSLNNSC